MSHNTHHAKLHFEAAKAAAGEGRESVAAALREIAEGLVFLTKAVDDVERAVDNID